MQRPRPCHAVLAPLVVALGVVLTAGVAQADRAMARRHFEQGTGAFQQGKYDAAIAEFQTGFREEPLPDFLYNIALAHQRANRPREAVQYYDLFLLLATSSRDRDEAKAQVARLRRENNLPDPDGADPSKSPALQFNKTAEEGAAEGKPASRWPIWVAVAAGVVTVAAVTTAAVVATRPTDPPVLRLEKVP